MTDVGPPPPLAPALEAIINQPLEEGLITLFLTKLAAFIDGRSLPFIGHIQLVLHLALSDDLPSPCPVTPLMVLQRLLQVHSPSHLASLFPRPGKEQQFQSLGVTPTKLEKDAQKVMARCRNDGIFALLWERERGEQMDVDQEEGYTEEDDEQRNGQEKRLGERGSRVLAWLLDLWDKDAGKTGRSTLFLEQLPLAAKDLARDNLRAPLVIVKHAFQLKAGPQAMMHRALTTRLIDHVMRLVTNPSSTVFHFASFNMAFLALFRVLDAEALHRLHISLATLPHHAVIAHVYTIYLEELAGIKAAQQETRAKRFKEKRSMQDIVDGEEDDLDLRCHSKLPPPTLSYLFHTLLTLPVPDGSAADVGQRMDDLKTALWAQCIQLYPASQYAVEWEELQMLGEVWEADVKESFHSEDSWEEMEMLIMSRKIMQQ